MRIALLSDLHIEFDGYIPEISRDADVCVLAGDIHTHTHSAEVAIKIQKRYGIPVVLVAGNHEHYGADLIGSIEQLRSSCGKNSAVHFLENDTVEIAGVRFLGCTLWTNFGVFGTHLAGRFMRRTSHFIQDFATIKYKGRRFEPSDAANMFYKSYRWLDEEMSKKFPGKTVVVTHFSPHKACIHPMYQESGMDELTPYFTTDCSGLMKKHVPDLWLYGHTHNSIDEFVEFGTRLVSNQRGYPHESRIDLSFVEKKIIGV